MTIYGISILSVIGLACSAVGLALIYKSNRENLEGLGLGLCVAGTFLSMYSVALAGGCA